ncbi:hypothetical protein EON83_26580 [bacterium]|nr:MAG: hypothetical protein EON83_26580 [bacterium]
MTKSLRIAFDSTLPFAIALYLGVAFWEACLKGLLPNSLEIASVLSAAAGFFAVLRWLKKGEGPKKTTEVVAQRSAYSLPNSVKAALETEDVWGRPLAPRSNEAEAESEKECCGC